MKAEELELACEPHARAALLELDVTMLSRPSGMTYPTIPNFATFDQSNLK